MQDSHQNQSSGSGLAPFIIFGLGAFIGYQMSQSKNRNIQFATKAGGMDTPTPKAENISVNLEDEDIFVSPEVVEDEDDDDAEYDLVMCWKKVPRH